MTKLRTADLKNVTNLGAIHFIRAEWKASERLAVIHYSRHGRTQELGLRLDMDKKTILDQDVLYEEAEITLDAKLIQNRTNAIWDIIAKARAKDLALALSA